MARPVNSNSGRAVDGVSCVACPPQAVARAASPDASRLTPFVRLADLFRSDGPRDVHGWIDCLGALVWPSRCLVCREAGVAGRDLCAACAEALPWNRDACVRCAIPLPRIMAADAALEAGKQVCGECASHPPPLVETHAAFVYGAPIDRLLPRFKFHQDLAAGHVLAQCMAAQAERWPRPDALIALPLHRSRLRQRGYDQALELAKPLARTLGLPLLRGSLRRNRATAAQSELDAIHRRRNVRGAFVVPADALPLPAHVALVDDVMTTGATLHAAARALRRAGVARIDAWVCARVP